MRLSRLLTLLTMRAATATGYFHEADASLRPIRCHRLYTISHSISALISMIDASGVGDSAECH